jgi:hypothetical protein
MTVPTNEEILEMPLVTEKDLKCPVCGETMRYWARHIDAWNDPPQPIQVELFLVCTCIPPKDFKL